MGAVLYIETKSNMCSKYYLEDSICVDGVLGLMLSFQSQHLATLGFSEVPNLIFFRGMHPF